MKKLLMFGIGSSFIGMILLIVGIATVSWLTSSSLYVTSDVGLWQSCVGDTQSGVSVCSYYAMNRLSRNVHTSRAFAVIGAILAIAGVGTAFGGGSTDVDGGKNGGGGTMIAAGVCGMIAAGVFTLGTGFAVGLYGYSFYLTWVQALFTVGGGIAIIVGGQGGSTTVQPLGGGPVTGQPVGGGPATGQPVASPV
ncbi:uncharacterized protein LOC144905902 [Branchiostoma floridae x Branchiostoma belcheri]